MSKNPDLALFVEEVLLENKALKEQLDTTRELAQAQPHLVKGAEFLEWFVQVRPQDIDKAERADMWRKGCEAWHNLEAGYERLYNRSLYGDLEARKAAKKTTTTKKAKMPMEMHVEVPAQPPRPPQAQEEAMRAVANEADRILRGYRGRD